jgi:ribulose-bisphosphate carboxylase large chain
VESLSYADLKYKPGKDDLVCEYYLEPNKISFERACSHVASESSIGTWTDIRTMSRQIAKRLKPSIFDMNPGKGVARIAYPSELFEPGNMPQILSSIAGNIFGMKAVKNLRLQDISFPKAVMRKFKGPEFGIKGIRKITGVKKRPLLGTIVKPKAGLAAEQHAKVAYEAWIGGLDIVKDDENLSSMGFNNFEKRVKLTLKMRDKAEEETGERKMYMPNTTAETKEMLRRARIVKTEGGEYAMVDIITVGWAGLQTIRDADIGLIIHAHRAGHGAFTENPRHGISMLTIAKCARLIGVDQLHVGAIVGKMKGGKEEVEFIGEEIEEQIIHPNKAAHVLEQRWFGKKPVFAVCSGGLHPGKIPELIKYMGNNIIIQAGGGVAGHPDGIKYGAKALRQALDAAMWKIPLEKYAEEHIALHKALLKWGK